MRLTNDPGVDKTPALAAAPDGTVALVWQGWRGDGSDIYFQRLKDGQWQEPLRLSDEGANDWNPAVATSTDGSIAVGWCRWQNGSYDVCLRVWAGGQWGPVQLVAASERFEAHPSLAYDRQGTLWIAYEEGRADWGMDSHTAGLRSMRNVRLRCYRTRQVESPRGTAALALPETFGDRSEMAHLATDGNGVLWLFFRCLSGRGVWEICGTSLGDDGWSAPQKIPASAGGQNVRMAAALDLDGRLRVVRPSDHRVDQVGRDSYVYASLMPSRAERTRAVERWSRRRRPLRAISGLGAASARSTTWATSPWGCTSAICTAIPSCRFAAPGWTAAWKTPIATRSTPPSWTFSA